MLSSPGQQPPFSDGTIRRFLLAQLSRAERSAFETALLTNLQLEHRARLVEIELIDDYAADRLRANERAAFQQKFLVTAARQKELEVSAALQRSLANRLVSQPAAQSANPLFPWPRLAWRLAFSILALAVLLASVMVIRREPQIVRKVIPKRWRPVVVVTPTPQAAHHATSSSESLVHRDEPPPLPAHEASPQTIVLRANSSADNASVVSLTNNAAQAVRLDLMLERNESATFSAVVTTGSGEIVHNVPEIRVEASDHIDFDVQIERLKPGEYQVTLTRLTGDASVVGTFYFRVQ
jgi:hypothetical protein